MTRETKIGLLVGLAFIIVIGILLSDHFTSTMQPPSASLVKTSENVLQSTSHPGARQGTGGDMDLSVRPGKEIRLDNPPDAGKAVVDVGPGKSGKGPIEVRGTDPGAGRNSETQAKGREAGNEDHRAVSPGMREYTAEPGDTLTRMTTRLMGKNTKANRDAIIKANPPLQKDPNRIVSGETYLIPSKGVESNIGSDVRMVLGPTTRPMGSDVTYTTKDRDSLWKIAVEQCGSGSAVSQIRELNKDVLKNGDTIKPNMKLRLPPKQVASAN
jgi:nucleoid-associated protein YgaU